MEVSQIKGLDTHAIIGGGKAQAFTMSDSAEFFTVLSDTLYRDKKRAVVREVICNAWDAHIVAGKKDVPVKITLTDTELTIQDFGPGIAASKIGAIYCRYGASTKLKDENQTGGFGLGSKAPFAYADHFSVTSCHDGFKHVYAVSRGGVETDGKPDFRQMVRVPTTETGVTVSIPLVDPTDRSGFLSLIYEIIRNGGMLAELNGKPLMRYDYEPAREHGFAILPAIGLDESDVYCLYGTVLYPVLTSIEGLSDPVSRLNQLSGKFGRFVIIAPPGSIGVTPSREGLSYNDKTTKTLISLIERTIKKVQMTQANAAKEAIRSEIAGNPRWYFNFLPVTSSTEVLNALMDLPSIARFCAKVRASFMTNSHKLVQLELSRVHNDHRRVFRRNAYAKPVCRTRWSYPELPKVSRFRVESRLCVRLAAKLDLLKNCYIGLHSNGLIGDTFQIQRIDKEMDINRSVADTIVIAFNQRDAAAQMKLLHRELRAKGKVFNAFPAIILKRNTASRVQEVVEMAKRYKLETFVAQAVAPPPKSTSVRKEVSFLDFKNFDFNGERKADNRIPFAPVYIVASGGRNPKVRHSLATLKSEILQFFPQIAVVHDAKTEALLRKMGSEPLVDVMMQELYDGAHLREVQYAVAAAQRFLGSGYHDTPTRLVWELCDKSLDWNAHFFPARVKLTEKAERIFLFAKILNDAPISLKFEAPDGEISGFEQLRRIQKTSQDIFRSLILTHSQSTKRFECLALINNSTAKHSANAELVKELTKYMERRHATKSNVVNIAKEAA